MTEQADTVLEITRHFAVPRATIFDAWTNPRSEIGWWGPEGFALQFQEIDLKPGGRHRMGMVRDGKEMVSGGVYRDVTPPERLVMTEAWYDADGKPGPETLVTITLTEKDGATAMSFLQTGFEDAETRDGHRTGWTEAFDALDAALAVRNAG